MSDLSSTRRYQLHHLRAQVRNTLCELEQLDPHMHRMTEAVLRRQGTPCGMLFCVFGPRRVRLTAVWDFAHNLVRYYDSAGRRFRAAPAV